MWLFVKLKILKGSPNTHPLPMIGCPALLKKIKLFTEDKVMYSAADLNNVCLVTTWESNSRDTKSFENTSDTKHRTS